MIYQLFIAYMCVHLHYIHPLLIQLSLSENLDIEINHLHLNLPL